MGCIFKQHHIVVGGTGCRMGNGHIGRVAGCRPERDGVGGRCTGDWSQCKLFSIGTGLDVKYHRTRYPIGLQGSDGSADGGIIARSANGEGARQSRGGGNTRHGSGFGGHACAGRKIGECHSGNKLKHKKETQL